MKVRAPTEWITYLIYGMQQLAGLLYIGTIHKRLRVTFVHVTTVRIESFARSPQAA